MVQSISAMDYPMILGAVLLISLSYCVLNLIVDILYGFLDPRVRSQYQ